MKILILGADGYLGWSLTTHLALTKHEIILIDNYSKRRHMRKLKRKTLIASPKIETKLSSLKKYNRRINFYNIDCRNLQSLSKVFKLHKPDIVIHFAEFPSAPLSMLNNKFGWDTIENNLKSTYNLATCVRDINPECHIVKLGTMGEYGTPNIDIEEGWITINHKNRKDKFLYPRQASSLYHTSKIMDTDLLWYYTRLYNLRVTDLMQGPVYGLNFDSVDDDNLLTSFTYDDIFGTVLNRFIVQSIAGIPLTIYGSGNQIRGYINIVDTLKCIKLTLKNIPKKGELKIYNQFTEQFSVNELAAIVVDAMRDLGIYTKTKKINNPRIEKEKHYYNAVHSNIQKIGLKPIKLDKKILHQIAKFVIKHKKRIDQSIIHPKVNW